MQSIITIIFIIGFIVSSLEYTSQTNVHGEEDLVVNEQLHITLVKDSHPQTIPAKIGIESQLWKDYSLNNYSSNPFLIAPLHTIRYDGVVYIKSLYDREFALGNFLDIWGIDKSKIIDVYVDEEKIKEYDKLPLTNGQKIKLVIGKENVSFENFTNYNDSKIAFEYPSEWNLINKPDLSAKVNQYNALSSTEEFSNLIELYPKEFEYMNTPYFSIQTSKLDTNKTIDEYYNENIHQLLHASQTTFPKLINKTSIDINGNPALKINLNTTLLAEPGSNKIGNSIYQRELYIWTIKNGYFYDISFRGFESAFTEYYPIINQIIKSVYIK
jgi:hypothetical protein